MTPVSGIGPWTAEVYLLFAAGHPDIFPARDVALQSAVGHALGIDPRPRRENADRDCRIMAPVARCRIAAVLGLLSRNQGQGRRAAGLNSAKKHENHAFLPAFGRDSPLHIPVMSGLQYPRRSVREPRRSNDVTVAVSPDGLPALVLNADYRPLSYYPLSLWSWQDAIKAVFLDRVNIVAEYEHAVSSPTFSMKLPSVVSLKAM